MYGLLAFVGATVLLVARFLLYPFAVYLIDPKGLRRYPNMSALSGMTNIPFMMEARKGFRSHHLMELHKKHPVIRTGPNSLSYGPVGAIKDVYGHGTKCGKDDFYPLTGGTHAHLADVVDKAEHQRKRKVLASAYAIKNLEGWEHKIADKMLRLVRQFDARCVGATSKDGHSLAGEVVDYRAWTNFFTMDAILDIGLSQPAGFLDRGYDNIPSEEMDGTTKTVSYREVLHSNLTAQSHLVWAYDWYHMLKKWSRFLSSKYRTLLGKGDAFDGIVIHQMRRRFQRYQAGEKVVDFFQALMENRDGTPHMLEWGEIFAELNIMLNAGSASTAVAINNAMYLLLKNPECLRKLREEIDTVTDDDEVAIAYDKVKYLPYLRACVDEAMRVLPPTPFGLPRKTPPEGCAILGEFVAGNTSVSMSSYVAHRDEAVFPDPERYLPERWLGDEGKQLQPYFVVFSAGARGCIGSNISYLEQLVLTATMVHRYDFGLPSPGWEQQWYEHFNMNPGPLPLKIRRRQKGAQTGT